ncbi:MAG: carboxypeptidase regulatory-like domain-containing protein [Bacteroidota bacterium]
MKQHYPLQLFSILLFLLVSPLIILAQNLVTVNGKVINQRNELIAGATINITGQRSVAANAEGRFTLRVPAGKYQITVSAVGYASKEISDVEVTTAGINDLDVILEDSKKELEGVVVKVTRRQESTNTLLSFQKNNVAVSSGLAADFIRRTPDRNTGEVLRRVSGASIQDNKFVIIRGLSDRYNSAYINGAQLPSSEPDKKAFSFDVIPSGLIDNIMIYKTATPDLTGEFAGGLVQITTKDIPTNRSLAVGVGLGFNTNSTFKDFVSNKRSSSDWLGFDDGSRQLPTEYPVKYGEYNKLNADNKTAVSQAFNDDAYAEQASKAAPIQQYNLTYSEVVNGKRGGKFGAVIGLTYRQSKMLYNARKFLPEYFEYNDAQNKYSVNWGTVANFAWTKGRHKIAFKNLYNQLLEDNYYIRSGISLDNLQDVSLRSSVLNQRSLLSSQLEGTHQFSFLKNVKLNWNLNYSYNSKQQPDLRVLSYVKSEGSNEPFSANLRGNNTNRFFSDLNDNAFGYTASALIPFTIGSQKQSVKIGGAGTVRLRDFRAIILGYDEPADKSLLHLPFNQVFNNNNIRPDGFYLNTSLQSPSDKYYGISALSAAYIMFDNKLNDKIRFTWGSRFEYFEQFLKSNQQGKDSALIVNTAKFDFLPSANLTYSPGKRTNLRLAASRTVARPEFREIAGFAFFDFEQLASTSGNPNLKRSSIINSDIRYEFYPTAGEILSAGAFVKNFTDPIELRLNESSGGSARRYAFQNAEKASLYGFEIEIRKRLSVLTGKNDSWLDRLYFNGNVSVIYSKVTLTNTDASGEKQASSSRPLQGQSPYLVNAGFQYDGEKGTNLSLLYNRIGERLALVGNTTFPDIYEKPRDLVDFQVSQKILHKKGEVRLTVGDILSQSFVTYQNIDAAKSFNKNTDVIFSSYKPGTTFTIGFNYTFDLKK